LHNSSKNTVSFSNFVETYQKEIQSSIGFIGQDVDFFIALKANMIIELAKKYFKNPDEINILDIGSGIGLTDHHLAKFFKNLHGVDVEEEVVNKAKQHNPAVTYNLYDGSKLPFDDNSIDMVFAINVMHHVPPDKWNGFAKEMHRVTKKDGISVVFEHNPLNPLTRIAVSRCEFDRDAVLIQRSKLKKIFISSNFSIAEKSYIVFFPFKSRLFRSIEKILGWLPLGAQYYITGKK
jgi:ubiquinone/menaquinone biosynthesis C-methylase UbiE